MGRATFEEIRIRTRQEFSDERGYFTELWNGKHTEDLTFKQDNLSSSRAGVFRGLHFQNPNPQGKLVTVLQGVAHDIVVDIRKDSPTFKDFQVFELSPATQAQIYIPEGFAHGFVSETEVLFHYKCTENWYGDCDRCLNVFDPELKFDFKKEIGFEPWIVSKKDEEGTLLKDFKPEELF